MDLEAARSRLGFLTANAVAIVGADLGLGVAGDVFFKIVDLIREHPGLRQDAIENIARVMGKRDPALLEDALFPPELVELLAHEFAWPEFAQLCDRRIAEILYGDPSFAIGDLAGRVREALAPDWEDREFYGRYRIGTEQPDA